MVFFCWETYGLNLSHLIVYLNYGTGIHKLITSIWKKKKLPEEWKESIIVPIPKKGDKTDAIIIEAYHFCKPLTKFYPTSCSQG